MLKYLSVLFFLLMLISSEAIVLINNLEESSFCLIDMSQEGDAEQESEEKDKASLDQSTFCVDIDKNIQTLTSFLDITALKLSAHQELNDPPPEFQ